MTEKDTQYTNTLELRKTIHHLERNECDDSSLFQAAAAATAKKGKKRETR